MSFSLRGVALTLFAVSVVFAVGASTAQAHYLGYNAVDDCEIRYKEWTKYDTERIAAEAAWEAINGADDCVSVEPDTATTMHDLKYEDVDYEDVTWAGLYYHSSIGADSVYFNDHYMENYNDCRKKFVAYHELGHAHGLAHSYSPNVMQENVANVCTLGDHDVHDYEELWGDS